jgi:voltage-gated potassium channel
VARTRTTHAAESYDDLPRRTRRRLVTVRLLRALVVSVTVLVLYFTLPLTGKATTDTTVALSVGLLAVAAILAWQIRAITRSPYPRLRAIEATATSFPLFLVLFAVTHYLIDSQVPGSYSQAMTRLDAFYFTVTVFTTVGFGDITAVSQTARTVTTVQMLSDLVLVGLIVQVLLRAVKVGLRRRGAPDDLPGDEGTGEADEMSGQITRDG